MKLLDSDGFLCTVDPNLEFVETKIVNGHEINWYHCRRCGHYMHLLQHFKWKCPHCEDEIKQR